MLQIRQEEEDKLKRSDKKLKMGMENSKMLFGLNIMKTKKCKFIEKRGKKFLHPSFLWVLAGIKIKMRRKSTIVVSIKISLSMFKISSLNLHPSILTISSADKQEVQKLVLGRKLQETLPLINQVKLTPKKELVNLKQ